MRSTTTKLLVINTFLLSLVLCHSPAAFAADRVRVGLSSFTPINAAVWIADR